MKTAKEVRPYSIDSENPALCNLPLFRYILSSQSRLNPIQKLVMLTIFMHRNVYRVSCYPSLESLVAESGLNRRTLQRQILGLDEGGHILRVVEGEPPHRVRRTFYFATWDIEQCREVADCPDSVFNKDGCMEEFESAWKEFTEPPF